MAGVSSRVSISRKILDEIALEGLDGVTLPSLWLLLSASSAELVQLPQSEQLQQQVWTFILRAAQQHLLFYELPEERPTVRIYNRFENIDQDLGVPVSPVDCPNTRYKFVPIQDGDIMGSCENYKDRKKIPMEQLRGMNVTAVLKCWGQKLTIVGSQELRYDALTPVNVSHPKELTLIQYCIWEAIGRSRFNGETTAGVWSLQHFCKDPTIVFYIKNKLINYGIVATQFFNETRNERLMATTLLTLPRFYPTYRSILAAVIERLFQVLKGTPGHSISMVEARSMFPLFERPKSFKKIVITHWFRRLFVTTAVPYHEYYNKARKQSSQSAKTVLTVTLRNPNLSNDEIFNDDENQEKADCAEKFFDEKHTFVDMPVKDEFMRAIERHGSRGCSQTELCNYLCMQHLTVRQIIKNLLNSGAIKSYYTDVGRQRINRYVALAHSDSVNKDKDETTAVLQNLQCAEEPNITVNDEVAMADIEEITARIKPYTYDASQNTLQRSGYTQRQVTRKELIIKCIDDMCIVQVSALRVIIQRHEKEHGYKDDVCRKSVRRLLAALSQSNHLRIYEIQLQFEEHVRLYRYVAHPKIDSEHAVLKREICKLKNSLFLIVEERRLRQETSAKERRKRVIMAPKKAASSKANDKKQKVSKDKDALPVATHKPPKFLISRYMHEFLFYIVVELNDCQIAKDITEEQLQRWQHTEPDLQIQEYMQESEDTKVLAYTDEISWRTFIPPLPKYSDKPAGWVYFMDAVDRMPLSLFNKIFRIEKGATERLVSYLKHPVRQHYLMRQLPCELQYHISRIHLQKIYITVLKLLNHMGLVQVSERMNAKDPLIMWVFLNRRAELMDTTSSEPSFSKINAQRKYPSLKFEFASFDDVHQYWSSLQRICVFTKLGFRSGKTESSARLKELTFIGSVDFDEAPHFDDGTMPGNHLGAAGLSDSLFAHTFRNWSWVLHGNSKPKVLRPTAARTSKHARLVQHNRKHSSYMPPPRRLPAVSTGGANAKRNFVKKSGARDAIDRDALKNMRTLRVVWAKEEDVLLKLSRAVYMYVAAPVPALGLLTVGKICRDIIRHNLGVYNKTSQACVRRTNFIVKQNRHVPEVPTWLHMLQTSEYAQRLYGENFLHKLKQSYSNRIEYCEALTIHFILLMSYLYKRVYNTDASSSATPRFLIPDSVAEFTMKFRERSAVIDEHAIQHVNPVTEFDLQVVLVNSILHSSLCCTRDKTLYNLQAFEIYKNYPEEVLHAAFTKARSDSLVVAIKRKNIQLIPSFLAGPAFLFSAKYRERLKYLKIPYSVYDAFYGYFETAVISLFGQALPKQQTIPTQQTSLELKSPHAGMLFFIIEGLAQNYWQSSIKLPVNILTVDAEQRQTVSSMDRILDHYSSIFDNAPQTEYTKLLESEASEKQVRVKFHPANLSYKLHYTPYDIISKLPTRYLHFFCALDSLQQEVDINFSKMHRKDEEHGHVIVECPFSCIMKNANYINAIERIVQEKKTVLNELSEMPPQKLLNLATSGCLVTIQTTNLLTLVRMLESFWREKELPIERKDLGKISTASANMKSSKSVDWQQLCQDILEFNANEEDDKNDEYEPTLNKEERIVRAQDVFVVNLPIISIAASPEMATNTDTVQHNGITLPRRMLETEVERERVLQKLMSLSYWKYTDNTFAMLKSQLTDLNFNAMEQQHLEEVYNYIESHKLGVSVIDLMQEFPYEQFLLRALNTLAAYSLIKRVGVATFMYVHKSNVRPWVVHTFHVTRLERENYGSLKPSTSLKRTHEDIDEPCTSKKGKLIESATESEVEPPLLGKRIPKPVKRFEDESESSTHKSDLTRDVIVMKPQPWIRLNGSLNRRVLDKWLGTILTECIARSGCTVHEICVRFPHMLPVDIMCLLEVLIDLKCIHLMQIQAAGVDLFAEYEDIKETAVTELYNPQETYVTAHADAVMRMAIFIGNKKYNAEFI